MAFMFVPRPPCPKCRKEDHAPWGCRWRENRPTPTERKLRRLLRICLDQMASDYGNPGGPLSRAERVLLSNIKRSVYDARRALLSIRHVLGAVPGAQRIDSALTAALGETENVLVAIKARKEGAP